MEHDIPESEEFQVKAGDLVTIIDWRSDLPIQVTAGNPPSWDTQRESWIFPYFGSPEIPGYAIWITDHWEDGEY